LIRRAEAEKTPMARLADQLASRHGDPHNPIVPIYPPEVWACGSTYETAAGFRDGDQSAALYGYVYREERPEIFFKGTSRVCVGPGQAIGIRPDSHFTIPQPELALVLGSKGSVVGYTLANNVSAWDLERENALYLTQSQVYSGSCALGPVIITTDEIKDLYALEITCTIRRGEEVIFTGSANTSGLHRRMEKLVEFLLRANPVPPGTVLLTGTGITVPETARLEPGDIVTIAAPEIGELSNPAVRL
jgi:2-dehydro-3-deoxy-D-arabinonate dehydratase